jgi:hypothetical protein
MLNRAFNCMTRLTCAMATVCICCCMECFLQWLDSHGIDAAHNTIHQTYRVRHLLSNCLRARMLLPRHNAMDRPITCLLPSCTQECLARVLVCVYMLFGFDDDFGRFTDWQILAHCYSAHSTECPPQWLALTPSLETVAGLSA